MSLKYGFCILFLLGSVGVQASSFEDRLIVSNCMLKELKDKANVLAQSEKFSLIETTLDNEMLLTLHKNRAACGKFLNLDSHKTTTPPQKLLKQLTENHTHSSLTAFTMNHESEVKQLFQAINPNSIWQTSQHLTSYTNRSAKTQLGITAAHWYKDHFDAMAREYKRQDVASYFVETGTRFKQPSVVTVIGKDKTGDALVLGAHIDTLSGNMPGADDDASGIAVSLEVARVLLSSELRFNRPIYIIAYAAEEQGLVGSSYVVQSFLDKKIPVKAVMQLDQAGFRANPKDKTIWLLTDYVDNKLVQFTADLLKQYVQVPVGYTECGYACSDHANWSAAGFSACYPSATTLDDDNPYLHSSEDRLEIINLEHMVNFTKLGLAFVTELAS
ncbi:MAG: M20/M25/M40 family metallo-hydrolase [Legionella sp.]|nr:M20/M25/M40 family metallo-hydrolase [Legionella sp.]